MDMKAGKRKAEGLDCINFDVLQIRLLALDLHANNYVGISPYAFTRLPFKQLKSIMNKLFN